MARVTKIMLEKLDGFKVGSVVDILLVLVGGRYDGGNPQLNRPGYILLLLKCLH
jgi:hypothetical protein